MNNVGKSSGESTRRSRRAYLRGASAAGLTALAGCAALGQQTPSGTVVQFAADPTAKQNQAKIEQALHDAGLSNDIHLEIIAGASDVVQQQYSQWLSGGLSQPSLIRMDSGWTIPFIARNLIANLHEELPDLAESVKGDYFEASVRTIQDDNGDIYGVPFFSDFGVMLYRKDVFEQAGYDTGNWATEPITWQRFAEATKAAQEQVGTQYGYTFQAQIYEGLPCCNFNEFMTSWGGSYFGARQNLFGPVGERPVTIDSDPVGRAIRMARTFINGPDAPNTLSDYAGPIAPQAVLQWSEQPSLAPFQEKDAVAHRDWPYSISICGAQDVYGENLGVMPMPYGVQEGEARFDGMGGSKSALGGWHVVLNPNAAHKDAALEILDAMATDRFYLTMLKELGYVPPKPNLLQTQEARNVEVVGRYVDTLLYAGEHAIPRPVTVVWPQQSARIAQQVNAALAGQKSPENAMRTLRGLLTEIENQARQQ